MVLNFGRGTILTRTTTTVLYQPANCPLCGKGNKPIELDRKAFDAWWNGVHIQNAFPMILSSVRETMLNGCHPKCFNEMFKEDDEE